MALDATPGNEPSALRALYRFSLACALGSSLCILVMQRAAHSHLAAHGHPQPLSQVAAARGPDQVSPKEHRIGEHPPSHMRETLLARSFGHIIATVRHAAGRATRAQWRFACLLTLVFSISNSTEGMSNLLTVYMGANGFTASEMAWGVQLAGLSQMAIISASLLLLPIVGSVEAFIVGYAALSAIGWATLAIGVALGSHLVQLAHYVIAGTWGMTIVMTRSLVVLYAPEASLGTALATLGMLDEAVTTVGDFTYTTLLALTAATWPPAPPVLAAVLMAACCGLAHRMATESPRQQQQQQQQQQQHSIESNTQLI